MIDLQTAFKLTCIGMGEIVKIVPESQNDAMGICIFMSRKEATEKFVLRKILVKNILPDISFYGEYGGTKFIVKDSDQITNEYQKRGYIIDKLFRRIRK